MSSRIEHANPFALLAELPNELVQTCFLRVPPDLPDPCLLVLLGELHRVLRDDGTLWITFPRLAAPIERLRLVEQAGWLLPAEHRQATSNPYGCVTRCGGSVTLCAKRLAFHFNPRRPLAGTGYRFPSQSCAGRRSHRTSRPTRRPWCIPVGAEGALTPDVIEWCIRLSTSPRACEVCGAAWRRWPGATTPDRRWRPGCWHGKGRGRCLVLDPFCGLGQVGVLAVRDGRSFLGVESDFDTARRASARLARCELEVPR
jgi:hypothetical protein